MLFAKAVVAGVGIPARNLPLPELSDSNLPTRQALPAVFDVSIFMLVELQKKQTQDRDVFR